MSPKTEEEMKQCPNCGAKVLKTQFFCKNCNHWLDNKILHNLTTDEKDLIITKQFLPATPSFLAFFTSYFVRENIVSAITHHDKRGLKVTQKVMLYPAYLYAHFAALVTRKRQGKEQILEKQIYQRFILLARFIIDQLGDTMSFDYELLKEWLFTPFDAPEYLQMFEFFKSLDYIVSSLREDTLSQFTTAQKFGRVIFGDNCPLDIFLRYYEKFMLSIKYLPQIFSKMLTLEEKDFDWRKVATLPEKPKQGRSMF